MTTLSKNEVTEKRLGKAFGDKGIEKVTEVTISPEASEALGGAGVVTEVVDKTVETVKKGVEEGKSTSQIISDVGDTIDKTMVGPVIADMAYQATAAMLTGSAITANPLLAILTVAGIAAWGLGELITKLEEDGVLKDKWWEENSPTWLPIIDPSNAFVEAKNLHRDPITLDLNRDGKISTTSREDGVNFDLDGNGFAEKSGWISGEDALLVRDVNGDGKITNGGELFGDQTKLKDGTTAESGFEALSELDSNGDGKISEDDDEFSTLRVWSDKNQDGVSQTEEMQSLSDAGVKSINLDYEEVGTSDGRGNIIAKSSTFKFTDDFETEVSEFLLNRDPMSTIVTDRKDIPEDIAKLPMLKGYGNIADLHSAMLEDETLKNMVIEYSSLDKKIEIKPYFQKIMYRWFGVEDVSITSRGPNIDARKLVIMEKLYAQDFRGWGAIGRINLSKNPNVEAGKQLISIYDDLSNKFYLRMNMQTHLNDFNVFGGLKVKDDGTLSMNNEITQFILKLQKQTNASDSKDLLQFELITDAVNIFGSHL